MTTSYSVPLAVSMITGILRVSGLVRSFRKIDIPSSSGSMISRRINAGTSFSSSFQNRDGRSNPFDDNSKIEQQSQMIDDKIQDIESSKALKEKIENNLKDNI